MFDADVAAPAVRPEQVVQKCRASSFALTHDESENIIALGVNQPTDNGIAPALAHSPLIAWMNGTLLANAYRVRKVRVGQGPRAFVRVGR